MPVRTRVLAPAAAILALAAGGLALTNPFERPSRRPAPFTIVDERGGGGSLDGPVGVVGVSAVVSLVPTAPFTLLRVRPWRVDPDVEVVGTRVLFWGARDSRTRSGYRRINGTPGMDCGRWPITGHGPTYPADDLALKPGDNAMKIVYYIRSTTPGRRGAYGYRIDYRTPDGRTGTVGGDGREMSLNLTQPTGTPSPGDVCEHATWTSPYPGYPG